MPLPIQSDTDAKCGRALRAFRIEKGFSQHDLAKRAGLHRSTLSLLESGRQQLTVGILSRLAPELGYSNASELLYELIT